MRTSTYVTKEDLLKIYPEGVKGFDRDYGYSGRLSLPERCEISVVFSDGPYSVVQSKHTSKSASKFILPKEVIRKEDVPEAMQLFAPVLDKYHKDHWYWSGNWLFIHYPELLITNSFNQTHKVYDLIVKLGVAKGGGGLHDTHVYGTRISYTNQELSKRYIHSHLHTRDSSQERFFDGFCLGSSIFSNTIKDLVKDVVTIDEFEILLIQLKSYLEWESMEGKPYISIRNLSEIESGYHGDYSCETHDVVHIAKKLLEAITNHPNGHTLSNELGLIAMDRNEGLLLELEKQVANSLDDDRNHLINNWNPRDLHFVRAGSVLGMQRLPNLESDVRFIVQQLNLTPRIVTEESSTVPQVNYEKRIHPIVFVEVIDIINENILLSHKPIKQEYAQGSLGQSQAQSSTIQRVDISNNDTASGMPTEQRVEWSVDISDPNW